MWQETSGRYHPLLLNIYVISFEAIKLSKCIRLSFNPKLLSANSILIPQ